MRKKAKEIRKKKDGFNASGAVSLAQLQAARALRKHAHYEPVELSLPFITRSLG